jgi:lysophospholipase L1-like esterase
MCSGADRLAPELPRLPAMMKPVVQNLLLLGITVLICLGGAEVFFRLFPQFLSEEAQLRLHWQEVGRSESAQSMTMPDPRFGYLLRPHFTGRTSRGDFHFTFHTDEHGFRNPSPWPAQADVVVVGDSLAFGYGVDDEQAWPRLVGKALPGTKIINLGVAGFGPQQYLRALESYGFALHPKLVLFMLFSGNDLNDAKTFQKWIDADSKLTYEDWRMTGGEPRELGVLRGLLDRSRLVTFLRGVRKSLSARVMGGTINFADGRRVELAPTVLQSNIQMAHPGDPTFELVMSTIEKARAETRAHGSRFLVLLMPSKEEVYLPRLGEPVPPLAAAFSAALSRRDIPFLDLTPALQAHARDAAPLFYKIDGHPNAAGYRLIARVVTDRLKEFGSSLGLSDQAGGTSQSEPTDVERPAL